MCPSRLHCPPTVGHYDATLSFKEVGVQADDADNQKVLDKPAEVGALYEEYLELSRVAQVGRLAQLAQLAEPPAAAVPPRTDLPLTLSIRTGM